MFQVFFNAKTMYLINNAFAGRDDFNALNSDSRFCTRDVTYVPAFFSSVLESH